VASRGHREDGRDEEEGEADGGRGEPRAAHQVAGDELWWENGSHHIKATHLSGFMTGLGLTRLGITPSRIVETPWLNSIRHYDPETSPIT
jgi:hypothetical protein